MFYNALSDLEIATLQRSDLFGRVVHSAVRTVIKKLILPHRDPVVRKVVHGVELLLPLSHDLPRYVGQYPYYDTVLPNLTKFLLHDKRWHRKLVLLDVGANVGDTAKLVSAAIGSENVSFICIEADEVYLPLLRRNTEGLSVAVHNVIAGSRTEDLNVAFARQDFGTSSIIAGNKRRRAIALDEIVTEQAIDLIKVDTDGYEVAVLRGLHLTLEKSNSLLFLEYSPRHLLNIGKTDPQMLLRITRSHGYRWGLIYDYRGYPMGSVELCDQEICNITAYCFSVPGFYVDLLLAKELNVLLRFYHWDLERYVGTRRAMLSYGEI